MTKINLQHVPYKGIGLGLNDLLSGQVQVIFNAAAALLPHPNWVGRALAPVPCSRTPPAALQKITTDAGGAPSPLAQRG